MIKDETGNKISSRKGTKGGLEDLLDEMRDAAKGKLIERARSLGQEVDENDTEILRAAEQIGSAALIFTNFKHSPERDMIFNPDAMVRFGETKEEPVANGAEAAAPKKKQKGKEGGGDAQSGTFIQYTCVRINSLLAKAESQGITLNERTDIPPELYTQLSEDGVACLRMIGEFPQLLGQVAMDNAPHRLAGFLYALSTAFNAFYTRLKVNKDSILNSPDPAKRDAYLRISKAVNVTLQSGLSMFNIQIPARM